MAKKTIINQYEGQTAEQVWDAWTIDQREHFLLDHFHQLKLRKSEAIKEDNWASIYKLKNFSSIDDAKIKTVLESHVKTGQYGSGGALNIEGNYLKLESVPAGLKVSLTPEGKEKVEEDGLTWENFIDYFDDIRGNSELDFHNDLGDAGFALTSAPGITDGYYIDDDGNYVTDAEDAKVYFVPNYAIEDFAEKLAEDGEYIFMDSDKFAKGGATSSSSPTSVLAFISTLNQQTLPKTAKEFISTKLLTNPKLGLIEVDSEVGKTLLAKLQEKHPLVFEDPYTREEVEAAIIGQQILADDGDEEAKSKLIALQELLDEMVEKKEKGGIFSADIQTRITRVAAKLLNEGITPENFTVESAKEATKSVVAPVAVHKIIDKYADQIKQEMTSMSDSNKKNNPLRSVRVTYENGDEVFTSMAAHLTNNEIRDYFKIGKEFNIGSGGKDNMQKVKEVEIVDIHEGPAEQGDYVHVKDKKGTWYIIGIHEGAATIKKVGDEKQSASVDINDLTVVQKGPSNKKEKGGALKANDIPLGATLRHKKTGAEVTVWNVDPKLGKMQLERDGVKNKKWYSAKDWEIVESSSSAKAKTSDLKVRALAEINRLRKKIVAKTKYLNPKEITAMWNENSGAVKGGVSQPVEVDEVKKHPKYYLDYLQALLFENELNEAEYETYFAKGGLFKKCDVGTMVQTLIFKKDKFTEKKAKEWAKSHDFVYGSVDVKENTLRFRQVDPKKFKKESFKTIELTEGVQAVVACPK